jgi:hypothetical protein
MHHSDYIVYVDESGDHGLTNIDPNYPVFVLAFCIVEKDDYIRRIVPAVQRLKFDYFGHDMVVLREADIRKSRPPFDILMNPSVRTPFYRDLNALIDASTFTIVASAIRKTEFRPPADSDGNPYHVAMEFGLERVFMELQERGQRGRLTHIVFERRGRQEDEALELEFRRIMDKTGIEGMAASLDIVFAHKQANSAGLQLADMVARPIGRRILAPDQPNRAWEIVQGKLRHSPKGEIRGWGLKCYP